MEVGARAAQNSGQLGAYGCTSSCTQRMMSTWLGMTGRPGAPAQSAPSQIAARRPAHACAPALPHACGWSPAFMSAQMCTAPLMPAQTSRNHSTLHEVDAWLGVEDFDEQMEKGTPYDAIGLLMKPLWSVLDAAADLGPRSADVSTNCGRTQWARCFITN